MRAIRPIILSFLFGTALILPTGSCTLVCAGPICVCPDTSTLAEKYARSDAMVLAKWVSAEPAENAKPGSTTFEIVEVVKSPDGRASAGMRVRLEKFCAGEPDKLVLLMGHGATIEMLKWNLSLEAGPAVGDYIVLAPPPDAAPGEQASYYFDYLECSDKTISADAVQHFTDLSNKELVAIRHAFQPEKLRQWLRKADTQPIRRGMYGLMLGLCGRGTRDATLLYEHIVADQDGYQPGNEGLYTGYLWLTGKEGLDVLETLILRESNVEFYQLYSLWSAVRYMWSCGAGWIPAERLKESMRQMLDRPDLSDLVISDLARWKDWTVQPKIRQMYDAEELNGRSTKRAIVRYMISSTRDFPAGDNELPGNHVIEGARHLAELRTQDPKTVAEAERYFFLQ
jgi:hypothetical protein